MAPKSREVGRVPARQSPRLAISGVAPWPRPDGSNAAPGVAPVQHAAEIVDDSVDVHRFGIFPCRNRKLSGEVRHGKDSCRCSDNAGVCTVECTRSRARRRCGIRCIVRSSRLGTYRRCGRCRGRLHGRPLYCSLMGTEEIRAPSRWTTWKNVRERSFQSKISNAGSCYVRSCRAGFAATRETLGAISLRPERDAACPANGITERFS
jgi:hypothetical protein